MKATFDIAASTYDVTFTNTVIGKLQRSYVYGHLSNCLNNQSVRSVLEINCGTGEDAFWLSGQGYRVTATDISEKMIQVAQQKKQAENITFRQADINALPAVFPSAQFDCIFSDFGGLNCLSPGELKTFFANAASLLPRNGSLFLVIMPKNTLWEQGYFLLKGQSGNIFRRKQEKVLANVDGEKIATYYYNPNDIKKLSEEHFTITTVKPVGLFVPPSYLETFISSKPKTTALLNYLENKAKNLSFTARYADHYFIALQKR